MRRSEKWGRDGVTPKLHDCREKAWSERECERRF
jgi:hypothetical protein